MATNLSDEEQTYIFMTIKQDFADFALFDKLVAENLRLAIKESNDIEINYLSTKRVTERYYDVQSFRTAEQKNLLRTINLIFKTCYVLILFHHKKEKSLFYSDVSRLLAEYPQFYGLDSHELNLLLKFRNMLKIALMVVPAKKNKQILLKIVGRLEGEQRDYITGGGQTKAVNRRVDIYEQETGVRAEKKVELTLTHDCIEGIRFKHVRGDSDDDDANTSTSASTTSSSSSDHATGRKRSSSLTAQDSSKIPRKYPISLEGDIRPDFHSSPLNSDSFMEASIETTIDDFLSSTASTTRSSSPSPFSKQSAWVENNSVVAADPSDVAATASSISVGDFCSQDSSSGEASSGEALEWVEFLNLPPFLPKTVWNIDPDHIISDREVNTMVYCDSLSSKISSLPPRYARGESHDAEFKSECSYLHTHA